MKTREKGYKEYGFEKGEEKLLKEFCKKEGFSEHDILLQASISSNPAIASDLFYSLINGISYDNLSKIKYIPLPKSDFYGYQRRCLSIFRNLLLLMGKWK